MTLAILDLRAMKHVKLNDGTVADTLTVHALKKAMRREGHQIGDNDGKQEMLLTLFKHREAEEMAERKRPANQGAAIIEAAKAGARI